jgi:hypothetical protein
MTNKGQTLLVVERPDPVHRDPPVVGRRDSKGMGWSKN